uniref:ShKT domain-containing protein n=1 Tax=Meloidogyne enterolobii TaxID=390850 RepID=A0A6V7USX0_MELEN|nr:unnamed protein product [Meloidogyne enterolobii]
MLHIIHFNKFWFLFYFLFLFFSYCQIFNNILVFAQDGVCSSEELNFGPCLPGTPKTCPLTCPLGCHCVENSCWLLSSQFSQNNFWDRINENSQYQQQQPYMGDQQQYGLQNGGQQIGQLNNYLLMLLLLRQQQQMLGGGSSWGCYDQADNCAPFSFLCFYSTNMLNFCPVSCGICPLYNPQFVNQRLLQMLLGGGGGGDGGFGQQQIGGGGNFGGGFLPFGGGLQQGFGGGGLQQPQQQQSPYGSNTIGRIQGFLDQTQGLANSANQALGTIGGSGLNLQTIGQALGQRLGLG